MAILKSPSKQLKTTTLQVRLEEQVRHNLDRYAEFIDANASYVVSEALKNFHNLLISVALLARVHLLFVL